MTTRKQEAPEPTTALDARPFSAMERPSFIKEGDTRGTENIGNADVKFPALRIAQSTSPEVKRAEAAYIKDLREGDLFNSVTKRIYGEAVSFLVVNQLGHRHIEFAPQSEGGGVIDFSVPDGDPRTEFTNEVIAGKMTRVRPKATKFYDYLVLVLGANGNEMMTMSLKSTQLKKAVDLNTKLKSTKLASFAVVVTANPVPETRGKNSFYGWKFELTSWPTDGQYNEASNAYDVLKGKSVVVEAERADEEEDLSGKPGAGDEIPF